MLDLLIPVLFVYLAVKAIRLAFRVTWGLAKAAAMCLFVLAFPALIGCMLVAGGVMLLIPLLLVGTAWGILKACL